MNNVIEKYLDILLENIIKDQQMLNNPWVIFTVIPFVLYCIFATIKWYFLLAPITVPFGFFSWGMSVQKMSQMFKKKD